MAEAGLPEPDPQADVPEHESSQWHAYKAWEEMYAAEGSHWFWWYGTRQSVPGGIGPFDEAFILHLRNIYDFARRAGARMPDRTIIPISPSAESHEAPVQGAMKHGVSTASLPG